MLNKVITFDRRYNTPAYGARNNDVLLQTQEPIGYNYLMHSNVNMLTKTIMSNSKGVRHEDALEFVVAGFFKHASARRWEGDTRDRTTINAVVRTINKAVIAEARVKFDSIASLHDRHNLIQVSETPSIIRRGPANPWAGGITFNRANMSTHSHSRR